MSFPIWKFHSLERQMLGAVFQDRDRAHGPPSFLHHWEMNVQDKRDPPAAKKSTIADSAHRSEGYNLILPTTCSDPAYRTQADEPNPAKSNLLPPPSTGFSLVDSRKGRVIVRASRSIPEPGCDPCSILWLEGSEEGLGSLEHPWMTKSPKWWAETYFPGQTHLLNQWEQKPPLSGPFTGL